MPRVMLRCFKTMEPFPTGRDMSRGAFALRLTSRSLPPKNVECPHCGERHLVIPEDEFLEGHEGES